MRLLILASSIITTSIVVLGEEADVKGDEKMKESAIAKVPAEVYAACEKALVVGPGTNDVYAALGLLFKVKEYLFQCSKGGNGERDRIAAAYMATWRLCLRILKESKEQTTKHIIREKWDECLAADDDAVPLQVYALSEEWDRTLLSDEFWKVLQRTKNRKTVSAIGYTLYLNGTVEDLARMLEMEKQMPGRGLANAISWLRYRLSGDTTNPGPASAPPRME